MLLSLAVFAAAQSPGLTLPKPTGTYAIGTQVFHLTDNNRPDPVVKRHKRDLMVQLWYPTDQSKGETAMYLPDKRFGKVLIDRQYYMQEKVLLQGWEKLSTYAFLNAKPSRKGKWPILLLEPGLGMPRENYTAFCEELASNGYAVAAIDPTHGGLTILPDGRILDAGDDPANDDSKKQNQKTAEWAGDMSFVLTYLTKHTSQWSLDSQRVGALGHSMGGSAALQAAVSDKRIDAALDMDGSGGVTGLEKGARAPMLFMKSAPNYSDEDLAKLGRTRSQWEAMGKGGPKMFPALANGVKSKPVYQAKIRDTGHLSFSDAPFLFPNTITRFSNHSLPAARTLSLTMAITRDFFDRYLCDGRQTKLLEQHPWPEVTMSRIY